MRVEIVFSHIRAPMFAAVNRSGAKKQHPPESLPIARQVEEHAAITLQQLWAGYQSAVRPFGSRVDYRIELMRIQVIPHCYGVEQIEFRPVGRPHLKARPILLRQIASDESAAAGDQELHAITPAKAARSCWRGTHRGQGTATDLPAASTPATHRGAAWRRASGRALRRESLPRRIQRGRAFPEPCGLPHADWPAIRCAQ